MTRIPLSALIGLFFTGVYFFTAVFAGLIAPYGVADIVGGVWEPASSQFLLGTDSIGRDLLSRMIYGGRTTILIATAATLLSFVTGSLLGFTAAVGTESSATVADYRQLSRSQLFDQSTGARGQAVKPDLEMLGAIRQRTNISGDRREQQLEYEFDFRVVDLGSGIERFQAFVPIEKQGSNSNFAW